MSDKAIEKDTKPKEAVQAPKRPGRRPMSAEEKEAAAKLRASEKEKADHMKPELILQYQNGEFDMAALVESAKADFHGQKKRTLVTSLTLYIKPEEGAAYYVINEKYNGKIPL